MSDVKYLGGYWRVGVEDGCNICIIVIVIIIRCEISRWILERRYGRRLQYMCEGRKSNNKARYCHVTFASQIFMLICAKAFFAKKKLVPVHMVLVEYECMADKITKLTNKE